VPVIVAAQLNRAVETRGKEARPQMSDLAESSDIEKNADQILLLHRDRSDSFDAAWVKVEKNRHGATGAEECRYNGPLCLFQDRGGWQ
jgi:replicative DNA helicase